MLMSPPVPYAPALRSPSPVPDFATLMSSALVVSRTLRPFKSRQAQDYHAAAARNGYEIISRIKDSQHVVLHCRTCGCAHIKRLSVVLHYSPECPHCITRQRAMDAGAAGAHMLERDSSERHYAIYRLTCGHLVRRQFHGVTRKANGIHAFACNICREQRYAQEAAKHGWLLVGPAENGKRGYRQYKHKCGSMQDIMVGNMLWGDCDCRGCSPGPTARPSCIYVFGIGLPNNYVVKLGYSARPAKRLRHQLGIGKKVATEVLRVVHLPTGFGARTEEQRAHRILQTRCPEKVVPKAEYGDAINVVSEIYRPRALSEIHALLDEIEARHLIKTA